MNPPSSCTPTQKVFFKRIVKKELFKRINEFKQSQWGTMRLHNFMNTKLCNPNPYNATIDKEVNRRSLERNKPKVDVSMWNSFDGHEKKHQTFYSPEPKIEESLNSTINAAKFGVTNREYTFKNRNRMSVQVKPLLHNSTFYGKYFEGLSVTGYLKSNEDAHQMRKRASQQVRKWRLSKSMSFKSKQSKPKNIGKCEKTGPLYKPLRISHQNNPFRISNKFPKNRKKTVFLKSQQNIITHDSSDNNSSDHKKSSSKLVLENISQKYPT